MAFDVQGALRAGHSEEDVAKYLAEKTGFDIEGARGAGYDTPAILDYTLNKLNANTPAPASLAPAPAVSQPPVDAGNDAEMQRLIAEARASISKGDSGFFRQALDVPVQVAKGAATGTRFIADVFGADNPVSQQISGVEDYLDGLLSAQSKQDQQEVSRIMQEAEDKGLGDQIRAGLKAFTVAPLDFVSNAFGTSIPVLAAGLLTPAGAVAGTAARVATGVGVLTGVGITKDAAYTAVYDELLSSGIAETEARAAAKEAQAYSGENLDSIALGGFLGGLASKFGLEATVFKTGVGSKLAAPAMAKTIASTSVKEAIPEAMQGGQEQLTRNVALQREGFDVPTTRGVATAATLEGTVGAPIGAAAGYRSARADARDEAAVQDLRKRLDGPAEEGDLEIVSDPTNAGAAAGTAAGVATLTNAPVGKGQTKEGDLEIVERGGLTPEEQNALTAYSELENQQLLDGLDQFVEGETDPAVKTKYAVDNKITERVLTERIAVVKTARGIIDRAKQQNLSDSDVRKLMKAPGAPPAPEIGFEDIRRTNQETPVSRSFLGRVAAMRKNRSNLSGAPKKAVSYFLGPNENTETDPNAGLFNFAFDVATDRATTEKSIEERRGSQENIPDSKKIKEAMGAPKGKKGLQPVRTPRQQKNINKAASYFRDIADPETIAQFDNLVESIKQRHQDSIVDRARSMRLAESLNTKVEVEAGADAGADVNADAQVEADAIADAVTAEQADTGATEGRVRSKLKPQTRPSKATIFDVPTTDTGQVAAPLEPKVQATENVKAELNITRLPRKGSKARAAYDNKVQAETERIVKETKDSFESITSEDITEQMEEQGIAPPEVKPKYKGVNINPDVVAIAESGNLNRTIDRLLETLPKELRPIVRQMRRMASATKIKIAPFKGPRAGKYDSGTNTITLNPDGGLTTGVFFHELAHAALARRLNDPNSEAAQEFFKFFSMVKDQMGDAYGGTDLDEFVSELVSNTEFRNLLQDIKPPNGKNLWKTIIDSIARLFGVTLKENTNAYKVSLEFVDGILSLDPSIEPPPLARVFYAGVSPDTVAKKVIKDTPPFSKTRWAKAMDSMRDNKKALAAGLKFLRMDNFVELYGKVLPSIADIIEWVELRQAYQENRVAKSQKTYKVLLALTKRLPVDMRKLGKLALNIRKAGVDILSTSETKVETPAGNPAFIAKFIAQRKAAGLPAPTQAEIDVKLADIKKYQAEFNRLDKDVQKAYKAMRLDYDEMFKEFKDFSLAAISDETLRKKMENDFIIKEPVAGYVPQRRFGDFVLQFTNKAGEYTVITWESRAERQDFIEQEGLTESLGINPETGDQATLNPENPNQYIVTNSVREGAKSASPPPGSFVADLFNNIDKAALEEQATLTDPTAIEAVKTAAEAQKQVIYETYLDLFPENSLVRGFRESKNIEGPSEDLARVYGDTMVRLARKMGNVKYNDEIRQAFNRVAKEAAKYERGPGAKEFNPLDIQAVGNEIKDREGFVINPEYSTPIRLLSMGSFTLFLAGNISSAMVNLTSIALLGQPLLNRDFAGREIPALTTAMKLAVNSNWGTTEKAADSPYDYKGLYDFLMDHAALKHTMAREIMEGGRQSSEEFDTLSAKVMNLLSKPFSVTEEYNRATIGIAAYKLAIDNPQMVPAEYRSEKGAQRYALKMVKDVNTSGMAATGPRLMQGDFAGGIGRATFTFKSFLWQSAYVTARAFHQSIKGETAEVRRAAFRQFIFINGMSFSIAGLFGMPFFGAISTLVNMVAALVNTLDDEEEEPFNARREMMLAFPEWMTKGPVNYLTNIEVSNRASVANGLLFREDPYEIEKFGYVGSAMMQAFGPMGNFARNVPYGVRLMAEGDLSKGIEQMVPSFLRNGLKTFRYLDEGVVTNDGISIKDDLTGWMLAKQFFGFSPADLSSIYETRALAKEYEQKVMKRRSTLLESRFMAITSGDRELLRETNRRLAEFRRLYPRLINSRTYESSFKSRQSAQQEYTYGLRFDKNFRQNLDVYFDRLDTTP